MHFTAIFVSVLVAFASTASLAAPLFKPDLSGRDIQRHTHARSDDLQSLRARDMIKILNARDMAG